MRGSLTVSFQLNHVIGALCQPCYSHIDPTCTIRSTLTDRISAVHVGVLIGIAIFQAFSVHQTTNITIRGVTDLSRYYQKVGESTPHECQFMNIDTLFQFRFNVSDCWFCVFMGEQSSHNLHTIFSYESEV